MILPVSGRKPLAGSSVVIRHCRAAPRSTTVSWDEPEVREGLARGDPHLRLHEVDVGDLLGHRVLDLDARVHLDEDVVAVAGRAGTRRCRRCGSRSRGRSGTASAHIRSRSSGSRFGAGRDLDDLLVAALHRAVALEEVDHVARAVGEDLHLDVARVHDGLLDEDGRVAEGALGLAHAGLDRLAQVRRVVDAPHAAAAAAGDGLDEERVGHARSAAATSSSTSVDGATEASVGHAGRLGRGDRAGLVAGQRRARRRSGR